MSERRVDLLRHGEAAGGTCFRGRQDDPLTPAGWGQLHRAVAAVADGHRWDRILTSPLSRCAAFAAATASRLRLPLETCPELRERDFGTWEGQRSDQVPAADLIRFWADPAGFDPPGAEPYADFRQRVLSAWDGLILSDTRHALILTHGGVIRVILGEVLGLAADRLLLIEVPPACRTRLRLPAPGGMASLVSHG